MNSPLMTAVVGTSIRRAAAECAAHAGDGNDNREAAHDCDDCALLIAPHAAAPSLRAPGRTQ